jgi:hypothetical protein
MEDIRDSEVEFLGAESAVTCERVDILMAGDAVNTSRARVHRSQIPNNAVVGVRVCLVHRIGKRQ